MKKKRLLAALLTLAMLLSMVPPGIVAEAADTVYNTAGQTYSQATNDPSTLPAITGSGLVWAGPEHTSTCTTSEHTHSNSCYEMTCGGTSWSHWRHTNSCYNFNNMTCTRNEHQHSSSCPSTYTWTVQSTTNAQWRNWWPIYWGYDEGSTIDYMTAVSGVIANGQTIAFTTSEVADGTALKAVADGVTGNVEDVLKGVTVEMTSGYYITSYRFVCGNHTGCGVTSYDERSHTANTAGDYTPTLVIVPSTEEFDHWANVGDLTTNSNGGRNTNYIPWDAPAYNASNLYSEISGNDVYPFYLLLEVQQDTTTYNVRYNWGELTSSMGSIAVPDEDNDLLRNATHTVEAPSAEAIAKAAELGYVFQGWKVQATGYDANAMVQAGNTVTIYGSDITLVAQWKKEVTVSYVYQGEVPTGAAAVPATKVYVEGDSVTVEPTPAAVTGYKFTGWTAPSGITVSDGKFTMPGTPVRFVGTWAKDDSQTRTVTYTVKYWFNGAQNLTEHPDVTKTETVWVNETGVAFDTSLKKEIEGWKYIFSDPENLALPITDGSVIHLYYAGNDPEIAVDKSVTYEDGTPITGKVQVGDTLKYTITITNKGNHIFTEPVLVKDTANGTGNITFSSKDSSTIVSHERKADTTVGSTVSQYIDHFTFSFSASAPFNVGDSYKAVYYYTVTAEDAGNTIRNTAYWNDQDPNTDIGADSTETEVENQYTLTINLHNENGQQGTWTSDPMNESASYSITIGDTHSPKSIVVGGITYAYDYAEDSLSGTMANGDVVVDLYYAKDMNGDEGSDKPDGTPDKYQVTIVYYAYTGGSIAPGALTREVVEIYKNGQLSETGDVVATGSTAVPSPNNVFNQWTVHEQGHASTYDLDLTAQFSNHTLYSVKGGKVYIYTAYFDSKEVTIDKAVDKNLANVGDTLHYEIHVHNTGSADLTNIVVKDTLGYTDDTPFTGKIVYDPAGQPAIQEGETPIEVTYDAAAGTFTIKSLPAGRFVNIIYTYTVQAVDSGKTLRNTAVVTNDDVVKNDDTVETPVNVKTYTLHYRNISQDRPATATLPAPITDILLNENRDLTAASTTETTRNGIPGEWKFVGWYKDEALTDGPITKYENITSDVAVYAKWEFTPGSYNYTIEYYYDLVLDETKTETGTAVYGTVIDTYPDKNIDNYVLDKVENLPLTVKDDEDANVIRVYYGEDEWDDPNDKPTGGDGIPDYKQAMIEFVNSDSTGSMGTIALEGNYPAERITQVFTLPEVIYDGQHVYRGDEIPDTVVAARETDYYFSGWTSDANNPTDVGHDPFVVHCLEAGDHYIYYANWGSLDGKLGLIVHFYEKDTDPKHVIHPQVTILDNVTEGDTYSAAEIAAQHQIEGFTFVEGNNVTITPVNPGETQIFEMELYYSRNPSKYTVHYYFDEGDGKDPVERTDLMVTKETFYGKTITLTKDDELVKDFEGYTLDFIGNSPLVISSIEKDNFIHIHYKKDPNATKTLSYTVEYYVDGVLDELETDKFFAQVWIGDADILTVDETAINTEDKYPHYKCVSTDPEEIPDTIADGGVIKVYYVKDEDDTKEVGYTVEFYKEGELVDEDTEIITQDVWAGGSDYAIVDLNLIDPEKYEGYDLDHTDPETVPGAVVSGTVIKVYYVEEPQLPPPTSIFGTVILTKVDANDTTTPLTGVVFELYDANEALIGTYTTDKNGQIKVENLLAGDYFWKEVLPAQGYTLDATAQEFTVYGGETTEVEMTNKRTPVPEIFTGDHFAYVIGYTDGNVKPTGNITRAEVATIFFRMLDEDVRTENSTKENSFSDVNAGDWFNHAVSTMAAMGVINGYPDGTFHPNAPITRAEFATLASRFDMDGDASDTIFKDIYEHWGRREINIAANNGWVLGYEDGTFQPNKHITRAEAMTMVNRVLQRIPQSTADLLDDMIVWPDNADTTKWYYLSVQEATNSHFYDRKDNGYETWTELREARNWAELEK